MIFELVTSSFIAQRHRLIRGLVEHIHDNGGFSLDGYHLLFPYAYTRSHSLSCPAIL